MNAFFKRAIPALLVFSAATASADNAISFGITTLGANLTGVHQFNESFGLSAGINYADANLDRNIHGTDYQANIDFLSLSLLANYHPFKNNFRITGGAYYNDNRFRVIASEEDLSVGDNIYTNGRVKGNVDFNDFAPYLGIGYGFNQKEGLGFTFDLGAMYQGSPKVSLKGDGILDADLRKEQDKIKDDLKDFKVYPVIHVGLNYKF